MIVFIWIIHCKYVTVKTITEGWVEMNHFLCVMIWFLVFSGFVQCVFRTNRLHIRCHNNAWEQMYESVRRQRWTYQKSLSRPMFAFTVTHLHTCSITFTTDSIQRGWITAKSTQTWFPRLPSSDDSLPEHNTTPKKHIMNTGPLFYYIFFSLI